jgi:hypothetical protein
MQIQNRDHRERQSYTQQRRACLAIARESGGGTVRER